LIKCKVHNAERNRRGPLFFDNSKFGRSNFSRAWMHLEILLRGALGDSALPTKEGQAFHCSTSAKLIGNQEQERFSPLYRTIPHYRQMGRKRWYFRLRKGACGNGLRALNPSKEPLGVTGDSNLVQVSPTKINFAGEVPSKWLPDTTGYGLTPTGDRAGLPRARWLTDPHEKASGQIPWGDDCRRAAARFARL